MSRITDYVVGGTPVGFPKGLQTKTKNCKSSILPVIPRDILRHLFNYCDGYSLINCRIVCKTWKTIIESDPFFLSNLRAWQVPSQHQITILALELYGEYTAIHFFLIFRELINFIKNCLTTNFDLK
jgi:hypothetical protein